MRARTTFSATAAAALVVAALVISPAHAETVSHPAPLEELNGSGVSGRVNVLQKDGELRVNLTVHGLEANRMHMQHIHGFVAGGEATCPGPDRDANGDGLISFAEGLPDYGPVVVGLGTDVTPGDSLSYSRTFTEIAGGAPVADLGDLARYAIVVHGATVGEVYDPSLPVACAVLDLAGAR